MSEGAPAITVEHDEAGHRFVASRDGREVGLATYRRDGETVVLPHTETDPALRGQGIASALIRATLDELRTWGVRVVPRCPFVAAYIERHPSYLDLLDDEWRARLSS